LLPAGFVPTENLRFREESLTFKVVEQDTKEDEVKKFLRYQYPAMKKTQVREAAGLAVASSLWHVG
jgi:translation initiation factor RLI1